MSLDDATIERLRDIGLFGALSDEALRAFGGALQVLDVAPGTVVFREGESGRELFVVLEGRVEMIKLTKRQKEVTVATHGPGAWFGEKSILDVMPRPATARATEASRLIRVTAHDLDVLYRRDMKAYALVVLNMAREISRKLRVAEGLLNELMGGMSDEYVHPR